MGNMFVCRFVFSMHKISSSSFHCHQNLKSKYMSQTDPSSCFEYVKNTS